MIPTVKNRRCNSLTCTLSHPKASGRLLNIIFGLCCRSRKMCRDKAQFCTVIWVTEESLNNATEHENGGGVHILAASDGNNDGDGEDMGEGGGGV